MRNLGKIYRDFFVFSLVFMEQETYIMGGHPTDFTPDLTGINQLVALVVQFRRASTRKTNPRGAAIIVK